GSLATAAGPARACSRDVWSLTLYCSAISSARSSTEDACSLPLATSSDRSCVQSTSTTWTAYSSALFSLPSWLPRCITALSVGPPDSPSIARRQGVLVDLSCIGRKVTPLGSTGPAKPGPLARRPARLA